MLEVTFEAATSPTTGSPTRQKLWDYLFGWLPQVNDGGLGQISKTLEKKAEDTILVSVTEILIPAIQQRLEEGRHVVTGKLRDSFSAEVTGPGKVSLGSNVDYLETLEKGSEPRQISSDEMSRLEVWAEMKFPDGDPAVISKHVAKSIEKSGNQEHPVIQPVLEETEDFLLQNISRSLNF